METRPHAPLEAGKLAALIARLSVCSASVAEDEEAWGCTALLHDFDYEIHPTLDKHPQDGAAILYLPARNYTDFTLNTVEAMLRCEDTVLGLGDGGAHVGLISDGSFPTYLLTHWTRDRTRGEKLSVPFVVAAQSRKTALSVGLAQACVDESVKYAKQRQAFGADIAVQPVEGRGGQQVHQVGVVGVVLHAAGGLGSRQPVRTDEGRVLRDRRLAARALAGQTLGWRWRGLGR